jgi:hypothetical protein
LAHLRTSGDFSDCVLIVGSGEIVEVCTISFCCTISVVVLFILCFMPKANFRKQIRMTFLDPYPQIYKGFFSIYIIFLESKQWIFKHKFGHFT